MYKAKSADKSLIVNLLTQAFNENKSVNYVVKQDAKRLERIRKLMAYSFTICLTYGEVWIQDDQHACALILFPDKKRFSLRAILWDIKLAIGAIGLNRVKLVMEREAIIKASYPKEEIAYLWFVGVDPSSQGKNVGSIFMLEILEEYKKEHRPIYLETSMERNLPFYYRLGFEMVRTFDVGYVLYQLRKN